MEQQPQNVYNNCNIFEAGSINVHAGGIVNIGQPLSSSAPSEEGGLEGATGGQVVPPALRTPAAQALLRKAQAAGWLDDELKPKCSQTMMALLASEIAEILLLTPKWKPFEEMWDVKDISKIYYKAMEQKLSIRRIDEIRKVLK